MTTYSFTLPAAAAPFGAIIYDLLGQVYGQFPLTVSGPHAVVTVDLPTAPNFTYHARCAGFNPEQAAVVYDDASTPGGTPTADTAFLLATGTVNSDNSDHLLTLGWDSRFPQVDWLTITSGTAHIPDGAGKCTVGIIAGGDVDFTHASAIPNNPGTYGGSVHSLHNNSATGQPTVAYGGGDIEGNGQDVQTLTAAGPAYAGSPVDYAPGDTITVSANIYAYSDGAQTIPIANGAASCTVAVAITRGGSAPTLPA